jgi:hypothetical protein
MPDIFPFSYPAQKRILLIQDGHGKRGKDTATPFGIVCSAGNSLSAQCKQVYKVAQSRQKHTKIVVRGRFLFIVQSYILLLHAAVAHRSRAVHIVHKSVGARKTDCLAHCRLVMTFRTFVAFVWTCRVHE